MSGRTREEQVAAVVSGMAMYRATLPPDVFATWVEKHILEAERRGRELERAERAKDTERLEWLARQFKTGTVYMSGDCTFAPNHRVHALKGRNFRDAIDAAMRGEK